MVIMTQAAASASASGSVCQCGRQKHSTASEIKLIYRDQQQSVLNSKAAGLKEPGSGRTRITSSFAHLRRLLQWDSVGVIKAIRPGLKMSFVLLQTHHWNSDKKQYGLVTDFGGVSNNLGDLI
jgi:hypothetical protein